jgi:hypothetical protein
VALQHSSADEQAQQQQQPRSSRSLKLFALPPPAGYGVTYAAHSSNGSSSGAAADAAGTTCVRARLLEPAPPAAYGVQYSGIGSSSSSGGGNALGRPRLFQSSSSNGLARGGSSGLPPASRSSSLVDGLKRFGSTGRSSAGGVGVGLDPEDEKSGLLLDGDLVRSDDSPWMSAEDRLSSRLGGLWEEKGKVSSLLSSWKQRLSAQA